MVMQVVRMHSQPTILCVEVDGFKLDFQSLTFQPESSRNNGDFDRDLSIANMSTPSQLTLTFLPRAYALSPTLPL
ncbi:hypothetical protein F5X96DRAFT_668537 [Biscogniauxia mediterranea]|nr:hypothetical protein F5X96DRAFT_668537 [Biscogniauxia mediterranea]